MATSIPWTSIKVVTFDIFGTLLDDERGLASAARATSLAPYLPSSHADLIRGIKAHDSIIQRENPTMLQREVLAEGFRRYAKDIGVVEKGQLAQEEVESAAREYGGKMGEYPAYEDSVAATQSLKKRYRLVPLTNVDHQSWGKVIGGPLKGCDFDAVYTAEDVGSYKPDMRNFRYLFDHLNQDFELEMNDICHVAQSLTHDHEPAKELGLRSVWVDRKGLMDGDPVEWQEKYGYHLRMQSLKELAEIVEQAFEVVVRQAT
ncbi:unnamed protein product [Zymoseptoria tritici ST99CH_3D1]|nr:unnamed protein product [Zymoseptoria tritici ST99CH_3D1]